MIASESAPAPISLTAAGILDVPSLELADDFSLADAREAIDGHILDQAEWRGSYTLNPAARHA